MPNTESEISLIAKAVALCLDKCIPFVAYSLPGTSEILFFSNPSENSYSHEANTSRFTIRHDGHATETIYSELDAAATVSEVHRLPSTASIESRLPWAISTNHDRYIQNIANLVEKLRSTDEKVVISRVNSIKTPNYNSRKWAEIAINVIKGAPAALGYIYYTKATGSWIGATPETLLDVDLSTCNFKTIALAGTRPISQHHNEWDQKNIHEHKFVVNHIVKKLIALGADVKTEQLTTIDAGGFEHLMTPIKGKLSGISCHKAVDVIHPTPAIVGFPVDKASALIKDIEDHPRRCYGGYIAIETPRRFLSHVNLRCFQFNNDIACFYGGGGITAQSDPEEEWSETEMKINATLHFLLNTNITSREYSQRKF